VTSEVEKSFMPWLVDEVEKRLQASRASRRLLDGMLREVVKIRQEQFIQLQERERTELAAGLPPIVSIEEHPSSGEGVVGEEVTESVEDGDGGKTEVS